ncbi:hypothetical protein [Brevibacillus gelatini]|uniref:hypothetical protein n=1 Tax=Brevibacillus gelatini TaxID=1655277 RepID=UPI001B868041|nr:hypothetical protein [Brevibacillus gelatini]
MEVISDIYGEKRFLEMTNLHKFPAKLARMLARYLSLFVNRYAAKVFQRLHGKPFVAPFLFASKRKNQDLNRPGW